MRLPLQWLTRRRGAAEGSRNYRLLAAEHGLAVLEPLLQAEFLASLGNFAGRWGFVSRTEATRLLFFGDLLPAPVIARQDKVSLNQAVPRLPPEAWRRPRSPGG